MIMLLLAAQAMLPVLAGAPLTSTASAPLAQAWSILQPVADEPCVRDAKDRTDRDIVVCGRPIPSQKLPYPDQVVPDGPWPSNSDLSGTGALAVEGGAPCSSMQRGCNTGIDLFGGGTQVVRLVQKVIAPGSCCEEPGEASNPMLLARDVVRGIKRGFARKPDQSKCVAIPLDDVPRESVILP